jgi:hypothetical protein
MTNLPLRTKRMFSRFRKAGETAVEKPKEAA